MISPEILRRYDLFAGLPLEALKGIVVFSKELTLEADTYLFQEGDPAEELYLIISGGVDLQLAIREENAQHTDVEMIVPGEMTGWSALVEPHIYHMSAVTSTPTRVVVIDGAQLRDYLAKQPEWGYTILLRVARVIGDRLSKTRLRLISLKV
jgi:CRP-like cAMP-binding protein